jgi:hypothetical protein
LTSVAVMSSTPNHSERTPDYRTIGTCS